MNKNNRVVAILGINARTEWQLAKDFGKYCSMEPKLIHATFS
jgi:hypothetical protein